MRLAAALLPAAVALWIGLEAPLGRLSAVPDATRGVLATVVLFAVAGFGVTRLLLPERLRAHELLWVLPVGACVVALAMTALGFAAVPFPVSLALVMAAGIVAGVAAWRRRPGLLSPLAPTVWALYLGLLIVCVAMAPMLDVGFATVTGNGSDAHLAAGSAEFLERNYPTATNPDEAVDRIPLTWRSKQPIYYALAGASALAGLEAFQTLVAVAAVMLALAAIGIFLIARDLLGARLPGAVCAMGVAGLNPMALHTGLNPYFNQTWGYFSMPFAIVLAWVLVCGGPERRRGTLALLLAFLAVGAFAYPLALPFPLIALAAFWAFDRRDRRRRGETVAPLWRRVYRGGRSLLWLVPAALLLAVPLYGVAEKVWSATLLLFDPDETLAAWAGDIAAFIPDHVFFSLGWDTLWPLAVAAMVALALYALRDRPRALGYGLAATVAFGLAAGIYFRNRDYGFYFHFKVLAFAGPLLVAFAAVGASRLRWWRVSVVLLVALVLSARAAAQDEINNTGRQLPREQVQFRDWQRVLPPGASIRLDMRTGLQLWAGHFLYEHPLCSQRPLLNTGYPHVPISRRADFVIVSSARRKPRDAVGTPIRRNRTYRLYRLKRGLPGPENCSKEMVQTITAV